MLLPGSASFANGDQLHVVATHGILADVARNVAGDLAEVSSLVPVGADQHGFVPSPSDLTTVANADLVLINGAGWEESLLDAVESAGEGGNIVNASTCVQIRPVGAGMRADEHEHEVDHADDDHGDEQAEDDHDEAHADDDDHAHDHDDDDHSDERAEGDHDEAQAEDDDHADDAHDDDDDHGDEHAEDDHDDEHAEDDDHAHDHDDDDDHAHDDHEDDMAEEIDCDAHDAEVAAIVGEEEDDHAHYETLGRGQDVDCQGGHGPDNGHGHAHGSCDPHLWLDPHNVIYWALMIRDTLSELDAAHADAYATNASAYAQEVAALEAEFISPALAELPEEKRVLITGHESLGYFATSFGFEIITTVVPGVSTVTEPSARDVAAVVDVVRDEGVPAIFSDIHLSDVLMNAIASETGVEVVGLHSDSLGAADGPAGTYLDYMRYNVSAIVEALKGDWR
ncbi:MAG: metal ABC transporter substrate-binding protein [Chloroflexi bacterium]|nr:metal ABC transporter substrate-binding protein [Chloroflexota bacterium]